MTPDELIALNEQIAGMARAGLPLDRGLEGLAKEMGRGRLRTVTQALVDDLRAGHTLPEAVERQRDRLPPYYAGVLTAGVRTGRIAEVLATLSNYNRMLSATRATIIDSLFYPVTVLLFGFALFALVSFLVLPQFQGIFDDFGLQLPLATQWVLVVGRHPTAFVLAPVGALVGVLVARYVIRSTARGRLVWAHLVYSAPIVGTLLRAARLAAFTDLLAVLVEYGVPLPEAFRLAGEASSDPVTAAKARDVYDDLAAGFPVGDALRDRGLVPEWVAWMTGAGAARGALGPALRQVADVYRRQVEARAALLRTVFPAFLIFTTASTLGLLFIGALMLPLVKLLEGLSK